MALDPVDELVSVSDEELSVPTDDVVDADEPVAGAVSDPIDVDADRVLVRALSVPVIGSTLEEYIVVPGRVEVLTIVWPSDTVVMVVVSGGMVWGFGPPSSLLVALDVDILPEGLDDAVTDEVASDVCERQILSFVIMATITDIKLARMEELTDVEADPVFVNVPDDTPEELVDSETLVPEDSAVVVATDEDSVPVDNKLDVDWEPVVGLALDEDEAVVPEDDAVSVAEEPDFN